MSQAIMTAAAPLWAPSAERVSEATMTRFRHFAAERAGRPLADTPALHRWSLADPAGFWDAIWDFFGVVGAKGGRVLLDGERMPGARFFPEARLNFAENLLAGRRRPRRGERRGRVPRRGRAGAALVLGRAARRGLAAAAGARRRRGRPGRPGGGAPAEHPRSGGRHARHRLARGGLVLGLARFRGARRARPLRPDRAQAALHRRRLPLRRQAHRARGQARRAAAVPADRHPLRGRRPARRRAGGRRRALERRDLGRVPRPASGGGAPLRAAALRPPDRHPLLLRHHRRAEMHRASRRRARCSTSRSSGCTPTCARATGSSTSPRSAG